ncbi:MAG: hypothetical protein LBP75_05890 [Planctomycetota bacterium]|jgi:hypothetical protein|nr:hypothetical protein [Planctomycetota bacterium]
MNAKIIIDLINGDKFFSLNRLAAGTDIEFSCPIEEYNAYLNQEAIKSQDDMVAVTYLLRERSAGAIAAYMSVIADAIKLSAAEKELHNLDYPFKTLPAMKIAKLAVAGSFKERYRGIGSYMIDLAAGIATETYRERFACRFVTVDADIEHDQGVVAFYAKNGFVRNTEMNSKKSKTVNMRKDLFIKT